MHLLPHALLPPLVLVLAARAQHRSQIVPLGLQLGQRTLALGQLPADAPLVLAAPLERRLQLGPLPQQGHYLGVQLRNILCTSEPEAPRAMGDS